MSWYTFFFFSEILPHSSPAFFIIRGAMFVVRFGFSASTFALIESLCSDEKTIYAVIGFLGALGSFFFFSFLTFSFFSDAFFPLFLALLSFFPDDFFLFSFT